MTSLNMIKVEATSSGLTTATTAYSAGDVMGAEMQWDMGTATYAVILGAKITDESDIIGAVDLYLYDRSVTFGTDNSAPSISDADNLFFLGKISFPTPDDLGGCRAASVDSIVLPVKANASGIIFGRLVTLTGHTFFSSGGADSLQVDLIFSLDQ